MEEEKMMHSVESPDSVEVVAGDYALPLQDCTPVGQQQTGSQDRDEKSQKVRKRDQKWESKVSLLATKEQANSPA